MAILPIFNEADCSKVQGADGARAYAVSALLSAVRDEIPAGRAIAVDIEPAGPTCPGAAHVDKAFIEAWFDAIRSAGYVPAYYGNTIPGSAFASAWCAAVEERPEVASSSFVWSFEPSLRTSHAARDAPLFAPRDPGCPARLALWQYSISAPSHPDVDVDLATSDFPIWRP